MRFTKLMAVCLVFIMQAGMAETSPPNILLIIADQHTGSVMSQRGYEFITTPGIDKIADAGVTFTRASMVRLQAMETIVETGLADPALKPAIEALVPEDPEQRPYDGRLARYVMQRYED